MGGFFYIATMIAALLTPSSLLAREDGTTPDPPPIPPEESGLPENCTWPGILINNSSKTMYIAFDKDDAPYDWIYRDVPPGTNSKVHTCDTTTSRTVTRTGGSPTSTNLRAGGRTTSSMRRGNV